MSRFLHFAFTVLQVPLFSWAQFNELHIKERFDMAAFKYPYSNSSEGIEAIGIVDYGLQVDPFPDYNAGENVGMYLEAFLVMYETTKDQAYLVKFVNLSMEAMAWRDENGRHNGNYYKDGILLRALSHFTLLVLRTDSEIGALPLPQELLELPTSTIPVNIMSLTPNMTYANVGEWFAPRILESLWPILFLFDPNSGVGSSSSELHGVNQEAGFAGAAFYLGYLGLNNPSYPYLALLYDLGAGYAQLFRKFLVIDDDCTNDDFSDFILQLQDFNAYWWYHAGWYVTRRTCPGGINQPNAESYRHYEEDISHALLSMIIPWMAYRTNLYTNGGYAFSAIEMVRFRNMFTKFIYQPDQFGKFNNSVRGTTGPISYEESQPTNWPGKDYFRSQIYAYMPLREFDGVIGSATGPGVYDILMEEYVETQSLFYSRLSGGMDLYGISELVAAHFENECFSLDLYNRELVYDQDFAAKNVLRVFPAGEAGASFADPVIYEPRFTVQPGVRSTFKAGSAVVFEPGFEATKESVVHAYIDPLGCDLEYKHRLPEPAPTYVELREEQRTASMPVPTVVPGHEPATSDAVRLYPNPAETELIVELDLRSNHEVRIELVNALSQRIPLFGSRMPTGDQQRIRLDVSGLAQGVYVCRVYVDEQVHVLPVVKKD